MNDAMSETVISSTEEPIQIPEAEEAEETEAADGQNGIQNDTEQEETDKQAEAGNTEGDGSTTLILQGMYCLQMPLKATMMRAELKK